jgi:outer membrane protein assembly factor BamE (lipoprotein component of BamABCDE complex)
MRDDARQDLFCMRTLLPKEILVLVLSMTLAAFALTGCGTDDQTQQGSAQTSTVGRHGDNDDDPLSKPPRVGMTQSEVRARYGEPDSTSETPNGETWSYGAKGPSMTDRLLPGEVYAIKQMGKRPRHLSISFDQNGRVKTYIRSESRSAGERIFNP